MAHVIITGGSSGIGLEVARIYLSKGHRVSLMARRADILRSAKEKLLKSDVIKPDDIFLVAVDVCNEIEVAAAVRAAEAQNGPCDVLVTSAGRVDPQYFDVQSSDIFDAQLAVNVFGTVYAVRAVLAGMKRRRSGRIMLISSGAALIGIPAYSAYCASKSALTGFAEALRLEARGYGVSVSICYPPDTLTPQYEREIVLRPHAAQVMMGAVRPWRPEKVAQLLVDGTERGKRQVHFGLTLKLLSYFAAFIKPVMFWRLARVTA
ncbi:SDR family NAD(P)-dependent oxidoreductase [Agrobacterium rubi]|uniref:SDR family NAD(P)-dependent oxidoreductase n=1 Tax=Agrobacterium rubi TaxID=28099 RepID=UPI0015736968|nr:SDR family NAD(P)-dependent oxidoreductase [Agrobacterium rubi]NTF11068.1 SDR family NAD(P)-dependent oxidoreductase [Agrobacterium rubi]NTF23441.1 SDR family NAD(P)-dependent oxidoreductase [Agrobacterium rubi]NTF30394.1 SDR family NAD(P)-dependent oxidoreductase [Agrobacterium rubi]